MILPRVYPILDTAVAARRGAAATGAAEQILAGGARILQYRHKGIWPREVLAELEQIAARCRDAGAALVVNDRVDIALLIGAEAVHLGQEDLTPSQARRAGASALRIGYSTHNENQLRAAETEPADYLAIGPVFGTTSKENPDPVVGIEGLRRLRRFTNRPVVAIGGITPENARSVLDAGADSVALIGGVFPEDGDIRSRMEELIARTAS